MAIASTIEAFLPVILASSALVGISLFWWLLRYPRVSFALLLVSLVSGQVIRYSLPEQGGGFLLSDMAASVIILVVFFGVFKDHYKNVKEKPAKNIVSKIKLTVLLISPFVIWSLVGLVINSATLSVGETVIAVSYWVRLTVYLLLLPALMWLLAEKFINLKRVFQGITITVLAISLLGFVQLWLLPDLSVLSDMGWDPHQRRLVSTWMDPNLLAGFLVMTLPFMAWLSITKIKLPFVAALVMLVPVLALLLTQSRSGLVALLGMTLIVTPLWLFKWLKTDTRAKVVVTGSLLGIFLLVAIVGIFMLGDRAIGLVRSDATVQIRAEALKVIWSMAQDNFVFGTGYNAYQFAALEAGLIGDFNIHSRGGADNSWLTLWVTTGIVGVVLWLLPWLFWLHLFIRKWLQEGHYLSLVAVAAFISLFIHSQFVNSFLYGHLLITLIILFAVSSRRSLLS